MSLRPLLLLDVDGVIHVMGPEPVGGACESDILVSAATPGLIRKLAERFELVWATSWEHEANEVISPILGIPPLRVIAFDMEAPLGVSYKLPAIQRFVGGRPFAWVDDDIGNDAHSWARGRDVPALLLEVNPTLGLTEADAAELVEFADAVSRQR